MAQEPQTAGATELPSGYHTDQPRRPATTLPDGRYEEQLPKQAPPSGKVLYTMEEVAKHDTMDDGWIVVGNLVYDITNFARFHPGFVHGTQVSTIIAIQRNLGKDCTEEFLMIHSKKARRQLTDYRIGELAPAPASGPGDPAQGG